MASTSTPATPPAVKTEPDPNAVEQREAVASSAKIEADAAHDAIAIAKASGPVPLNLPAEDGLGRTLPRNDLPKARQMQREAVQIKAARMVEDVDRVNHGLAPKWADK